MARHLPGHLFVYKPVLWIAGAPMIGRVLLAILFLVAGALHFFIPQVYIRIMPPYLPWHAALVYISGVAEMLGGVGLMIPATRPAAAWGLVLLLLAVSPANVYMAMAHLPAPGIMGESWAQWLRIPLQLPLIYWAWIYTRA
jgi:uncharacterized membrane protein